MSDSGWKFEILTGLPTSGDLPIQFSATGMGMHSEGLVVRFFADAPVDTWVGNFQRGLNRFDSCFSHPNTTDFIVMAGGQAYVIDPKDRSLKEHFGAFFETVTLVAEKNLYILGTPIDFEAVGADGRAWRSRRVAMDGIRSLALDGNRLHGESYCLEDDWLPFSLNVQTGEVEGGDETAWPL